MSEDNRQNDGLTKHASESTANWIQVTDEAPFSPRDTAEPLVFADKMWISNGYYHGDVLTRDLWSTSDGRAWTRINNATPYDGYSELVAHEGRMLAVKGSVWASTDGVEWSCLLAETPFGGRGYGETLVHDGKIWQLGSGADVWSSPNGKDWTCVCEAAPYGARSATAVGLFAGKMWVMGGSIRQPSVPPEKSYPGSTTFNDVWCSADGVTWTRVLEHAPWCPRQWFVAEAYADRLWIIGGFDNRHSANLGDVWSTRDGATWKQLETTDTFTPRHEPTQYVYDDSLWVVAGNSWPVKNDVWRLTL